MLRPHVLDHAELGLDLAAVLAHSAEHLQAERLQAAAEAALREVGLPAAKGRRRWGGP